MNLRTNAPALALVAVCACFIVFPPAAWALLGLLLAAAAFTGEATHG